MTRRDANERLPLPGRSAAPTVAYGSGAVARIPQVIEGLRATRVLLVCGRNSFEASGASAILPDLERVSTVLRWSDFEPNTDSSDLVVGLEIMREFEPDLVLAVGGGSALDMAKLLVSYEDLPADGVFAAIESGRRAEHRWAHLVLAPTTSGSGAEATHFAVVYIGEDKYSIAGPAMRADALVLDPALTLSGSLYQRATSGIDAVAQAIESIWATGATDRSRRFARHGLRLLLPALEPFVNDPDESVARAMMIGSHLAGRAIDISKTTAAHALSYGITKRYGVSHGHAVALSLGAFIEAHAGASSGQLQSNITPAAHASAMEAIMSDLGAATPSQARQRFTDLMTSIGLDPSLHNAAGGAQIDEAELAAGVNTERLGNNPVTFDTLALSRLLASAR